MKRMFNDEGVYIARREDGMWGLFASDVIPARHPIIFIDEGDLQEESDFRTVEIADGHYFHPFGIFTNHSCDPTAYVHKVAGGLFAVKQIEKGEEITFDYLASETSLQANFVCSCGAHNCFGKIGTDK